MKVLELGGETARNRWSEMIDTALSGGRVIIKRRTRPVAVLVNFERWRVLEDAFVAMLKQRSQEMETGQNITQEQFEAELRAEGIL
jgi:prevent-host-death family protein